MNAFATVLSPVNCLSDQFPAESISTLPQAASLRNSQYLNRIFTHTTELHHPSLQNLTMHHQWWLKPSGLVSPSEQVSDRELFRASSEFSRIVICQVKVREPEMTMRLCLPEAGGYGCDSLGVVLGFDGLVPVLGWTVDENMNMSTTPAETGAGGRDGFKKYEGDQGWSLHQQDDLKGSSTRSLTIVKSNRARRVQQQQDKRYSIQASLGICQALIKDTRVSSTLTTAFDSKRTSARKTSGFGNSNSDSGWWYWPTDQQNSGAGRI
ncbi:hypothetical protein PPACK8108_LOCUS13633 [Phakopsora pachyrhizi]|uniref:Uncharacterized protein n=1 Tax=Phakopsora pachyrhizi TaxID=170000 RepID=A0AAV0B5Y9_PHAPC|nr:hypothetical protein PPACK8108_LOCUS13633 [Phakopsora pachyrhizi]